jgi:hypothetical protein
MAPRKHREGAERKQKRHVAFSKRRNTLFSMADDLSALNQQQRFNIFVASPRNERAHVSLVFSLS